jgi:hypothetical protein
MPPFAGFVGGTYQHGKADWQRSINLIPEPVESGAGVVELAFRPAPGKHTFCTLPQTPLRGLWAGYNRLFAAAGSKLYEVFSDATYSLLGDIGDDAQHSPVEIYPNGTQIGIISAGKVYFSNGGAPQQCRYTIGGTVSVTGINVVWVDGDKFTPEMVGNWITIDGVPYTIAAFVSDTNVQLPSAGPTLLEVPYEAAGGEAITASQGAFLDTFLIACKPDTKQYNISASNDFSKWDPLDFASKEAYPDAIIACLADHEELWLWGTETTEAHRNEGGADFPFQRDPSAFNHLGIAAPYSRVRLDATVFALVGDARNKVYAAQFQGFMPKRISTHAIEKAWSAYSTVLDAEAYSYVENGHSYWVITFPTANATWVYDTTTGLWHERAWWDGAALQRDRGRGHCYVFGKHFVGDYSNGKIYEQSETFSDDFGGDRVYERTAPYIAAAQNRVFHHRLQLLVENRGAGAISATVTWSDDEGATYSTGRTKSAAAGARRARFIWRKLGEARQRIYKSRMQTQQPVAITGALLDVTPGMH